MALDYKSSLLRYRKYLTVVSQQPLWQASLVVILSLILLIVLLVFVLRPTLITISALFGQIETQRRVDRQLDAKIAALQQAQTLLNSIQPRLVYLNASLPTSPALGPWAQAIETVASGSGVFVTDFTISDVDLTPPASASAQSTVPTQIDFKITAVAGYPQLIDFVAALERLPRLAILTSTQLDRQNDGSLNLVITGVISTSPN